MVKNLQWRRPRFTPWVGKVPWRRKWQPSPVFLPGEFHGQRNLAATAHGSQRVGHNWVSNTFTFKLHLPPRMSIQSEGLPPSQLLTSPLPVTRNPAWTLDAGVRWQLGGAVLFLQGTFMTLRFFRMCLTFCLFPECTRLTFTLLPEPRHCKVATVWFWMNVGLLASAWASEKRKTREENEASS